MIETSWRISIGLNDEANTDPEHVLDVLGDDYAAFRRKLSRRESLRAALTMAYLYRHPLSGTRRKRIGK